MNYLNNGKLDKLMVQKFVSLGLFHLVAHIIYILRKLMIETI